MSKSSPQPTPTSQDGTPSAQEAEQDIGAPERVDPNVKSPNRRRRIWWAVRAVLLILMTPALMLVVAAVLMIGREVSAPSWVVRDVEARSAEVLAGGSLDFGAMKITVGRDLHPHLVLENVILRDADRAILANVPRISGMLSPRGVLQGRILVQEIEVHGAQLSLRRASDGTVAFAFEQGGNPLVAADGFLGLLDQIDQVFEEGALEALEQVRADGVIINYVDARAARSWVVDGGRIELDLRDGELALRADVALLSGRSYVSTAQLTYGSARGSRTAQIGISITDAAAADIASQSPLLAWLGALDAPISGAVRGELDEQGALTTASATLQIGAGQLQPTSQTRPIPFQSARTYLSFEPQDERLNFDLIEVDSSYGRIVGRARTYMREFENGWPEALLGQVQFTEMHVAPEGVYETPIELNNASVDFRLRMDPFTFDIGQAVAQVGETPLRLSGRIQAATQGWSVALDASADEIDAAQVLDLWPVALIPRTRDWIVTNITGGTVRDATVALRVEPNRRPDLGVTLGLGGAQVRYMPTLPPIEEASGTLSILDRRLSLSLDAGHVVAPTGGRLDLAGSTMVIPQTDIPNPPTQFGLMIDGRITAAMSVLARPPFNILRNSDLPVSFAQGRAIVSAQLDMPLGDGITPEQRVWSAEATLRDVRSDALVPDQTVTASSLQLQADAESLVISGPARMGAIGGSVTFSRALGAGSEGTARLQAQVNIGPAVLDALDINLPDGMVNGEGPAQLTLDLSNADAPQFRLTSDLRGVGLSLAAVGWSKARSVSGALTVVGHLGNHPQIDQLSISAPGLATTGTVRLAAGGGLERAAFENVRLGGWLNAPVVLLGRGQGRPFGVQIAGGTLDLRNVNFPSGGSGEGGDAGPMDIALDSLIVANQIRIDDFRGNFTSANGMQGEFSGNVNSVAPVRGTMVPMGGRPAVRITSDDAGSLLRATGLLRNANGGDMQLTLIPSGAEGSYDGTVVGNNLRVEDAPALASLLDAISVVGLLTQLDGQGLLFNDVNAQFRLTPNQVIVTQASAIGPGLGISLDGIYSQAAQTMDFQGVVSPFYLINGIGSILTRPGEGLIGFNFNLRGPVDNPQVLVNPLSVLTPGMFREIFRRPVPTVSE